MELLFRENIKKIFFIKRTRVSVLGEYEKLDFF